MSDEDNFWQLAANHANEELEKAQGRLTRARDLLEQALEAMSARESRVWAAEVNGLLSECRADETTDAARPS